MFGDFKGLLEKAHQMKKGMEDLQDKLRTQELESSAGGGLVEVRMSGDCRLTSIAIEDSLLNVGDKQMLQDLICAAVNDCVTKAKDAAKDEMKQLAGGLPIPSFF